MKKKICLVGDFSVGKTSLTQQFVKQVFSDQYLTTVGVKIDTKSLLLDEKEVKLVIWDVAGRDVLSPLNANYLVGAAGFLLVIDGTRRDTIQSAKTLIETVKHKNAKATFVVLVNKNDLHEQWQFTDRDHEEYIALGWHVMTSSAKTGENVEEAFRVLARKMLES